MKLLTKSTNNYKLSKNSIVTYSLNLMPSTSSGIVNTCSHASAVCAEMCVAFCGKGVFKNVKLSRTNKTQFWATDRANFYIQLVKEIQAVTHTAVKKGKQIALRLNCYSDIPHVELIKRYTGIDLLTAPYVGTLLIYDYTKNPLQALKYINTPYKLTFSRSETNEATALNILKDGGNVAVVFKDRLPETWHGYKVINGDETDLRYNDPANVVVGLLAKGKAKKDTSGFAISAD